MLVHLCVSAQVRLRMRVLVCVRVHACECMRTLAHCPCVSI